MMVLEGAKANALFSSVDFVFSFFFCLFWDENDALEHWKEGLKFRIDDDG